EDVEPAPGVTEDVLPERHVLDRAPRCSTLLVPDGEEDGEPILVVPPVVLEEIALDEHPASIFQLEEILDRPRPPGISRMPDLPGQRLEEMVAADLDIGGDEIRNRWIGSPEHEVLPRSFEVVVDDLEWARAVPTRDSL